MSTKRTALFALACLAISLLVAGPAFGQFSCPYPGPGNIAFCEKYVPAKAGTAIQPVYGAGIDPDVRPFQPVLRSEDRRCRGTICDFPNVPEAKPGEQSATIKKEVVYSPIIGGLEPGRGGNVQENWDYWKAVSADGTQVEIRGGCYSACTLVMSHVPWERICFGEHSSLNFHLARSGKNGGPKALDTSLRMINSYPLIIRGWILGKGGIENMPYDGFWQLPAKVLWDMGYRRCAQ